MRDLNPRFLLVTFITLFVSGCAGVTVGIMVSDWIAGLIAFAISYWIVLIVISAITEPRRND